MDTLQELILQKGVIAKNIVNNITLPDPAGGLPIFPESEFEKAIAEGSIVAFSVENISQFVRNLQKAEADAKGDPVLLADIEKGRKDISKLIKVKKQDKRGKMTTVYVRANDQSIGKHMERTAEDSKSGKLSDEHYAENMKNLDGAYGGNKDSEPKNKTPRSQTKKSGSNLSKKPDMHDTGMGVHVPKKMNHKGLGALEHSRDEEGEGGQHKHYYKDKDGHEVHFTTGTLQEHGMAEKPKHKDHGKTFPVDWDGPSKVKVVGADEKHVHVKRVGEDGKELDGEEHNMSYSHDEWKEEKQSGKSLHQHDPKAFGDEPKKESNEKRQDRQQKESLDKLDKQQKEQTLERKKRNDAVRQWSGDEYTDSMIDSLEISYEDSVGEGEDLHSDISSYVNMIGEASSQSRRAQQVYNAVDDLFGEIKPGSWHKDLDEQGVRDILWGLIMHKLNNK